MIFCSERENLPLANTAASLSRLLIHTLISLPACQLDGYFYQVEKGFLAQVRQCQSLLSVSKLMVTKISSVHFLFPLRVLKLEMLKLSNLNIINDNSKLLSVSSPVTSPSDVFYTVAENIKLKERFSLPHPFFFICIHLSFFNLFLGEEGKSGSVFAYCKENQCILRVSS